MSCVLDIFGIRISKMCGASSPSFLSNQKSRIFLLQLTIIIIIIIINMLIIKAYQKRNIYTKIVKYINICLKYSRFKFYLKINK